MVAPISLIKKYAAPSPLTLILRALGCSLVSLMFSPQQSVIGNTNTGS